MTKGLKRVVLALAVCFAGPAVAQDNGIAIAKSADDGYFASFGPTADGTLNAARAKCRSEGGEDCLRVRWCFPAGTSGAMTYLEGGEITRVTFMCGMASEAVLARTLAAQCAANTAMSQCRLMAVWSPSGNETQPTTPLGKNTLEVPEGATRQRTVPGRIDAGSMQ